MFNEMFAFELYTVEECKSKVKLYLEQHYNQDRIKAYNKAKKLNAFLNVPDTTEVVFGKRSSKYCQRITHALTQSVSIYEELGLELFEPESNTRYACEQLYNKQYMVPTIRAISDKVLFYLMLQFDSGFVRYCTSKEEYKLLSKVFDSDSPTFSTAYRLRLLNSFSGALV